MLQFDEKTCRLGSNVAHKVRRYKSEVASGFMPDVLDLVHDSKECIPVRTYLTGTNNSQIRLRRISVFLPSSLLAGIQRRAFINLARQHLPQR